MMSRVCRTLCPAVYRWQTSRDNVLLETIEEKSLTSKKDWKKIEKHTIILKSKFQNKKPILCLSIYKFSIFPSKKKIGCVMELDMLVLSFIWKNEYQPIIFF